MTAPEPQTTEDKIISLLESIRSTLIMGLVVFPAVGLLVLFLVLANR